jgi:hypothetical protein
MSVCVCFEMDARNVAFNSVYERYKVLVYFGTLHRCTSSCINPDTFLFVMDSHVTYQLNQDLKRT